MVGQCLVFMFILVNNGRTMSGVHVYSDYVTIEFNDGRLGTMMEEGKYG